MTEVLAVCGCREAGWLDGFGGCGAAVVVVHGRHLLLLSVRRRLVFLVPVLDVLDGLRQRAVERLGQKERQQTAAD